MTDTLSGDRAMSEQTQPFDLNRVPVLDDFAPSRAIWTDASLWRGGHSWAWVDDAGYFAHGRGMGWAVDINDAELWAIVEGLRAAPAGQIVHVNTDSETAAALMRPFAVVDGVQSNAPRDSSRYREVLEDVAEVAQGKTVIVHWLKGHGPDIRNIAADRLATAARWDDTSPEEWMRDCAEALVRFGSRFGQRSEDGPLCVCGNLPT